MISKMRVGFIAGIFGAGIFYFTGIYTDKYSMLTNIISTILLGWVLGFIGELISPTDEVSFN